MCLLQDVLVGYMPGQKDEEKDGSFGHVEGIVKSTMLNRRHLKRRFHTKKREFLFIIKKGA